MNVQFQTFVTRKLDVLTQWSHLYVNAMLDILGMVRNAKVMMFLKVQVILHSICISIFFNHNTVLNYHNKLHYHCTIHMC